MVPIRENLLSKRKYDLKVPVESCAKDMKYIVVHNTANDASAANEVAYMIRNDSSTSFKAAVDDKEIIIGAALFSPSQAPPSRRLLDVPSLLQNPHLRSPLQPYSASCL